MLLRDSDRTKSLLHQYHQPEVRFRPVLVKSNFYFLFIFPIDLYVYSLSEAGLTGRRKG